MGIDENTIIRIISERAEIPKNQLAGTVPTVTGFADAVPGDLANATDGDVDSYTSTGTKINGGAGDMGTFVFDIERVRTMMISARVGVWASAGNVQSYIESSDDGINYRGATGGQGASIAPSITSATEKIVEGQVCVITGKYFRLRFYAGAASTANVRVYEVRGSDIPL